jgi:hypothetical protein
MVLRQRIRSRRVASEEHLVETIDGRETIIPRGALARYREWYGAKKDAPGDTRLDSRWRVDRRSATPHTTSTLAADAR